MPDDDLERRLRRVEVESAETRWLALRVDNDVREIRDELRVVAATQQEHTELLQSHTARFDSIDAKLRSLTQLVGEVLRRLPEPGENGG